jgi:Copper type II ascorbate-dependent monooxygenase, C-terminal domain
MTMTMRPTPALLCLTVLLAACGGEQAPAPPPASEPSDIGETFTEPDCDSGELCLQVPAEGFQLQSVGTEIAPGEDVEYCEAVLLPGDESDVYYVNGFETQMTTGSHHLIIAAVQPGTETDENTPLGERVPCTGPDVWGGELVPVTGAQQPYSSEKFPEGVGRIYRGGQKVVFDYHYFNTTPEPISAQSAVNFHTTGEENVTKISRSFGFYNLGIEIPPGAEASFQGECFFDDDVYVHKLTRHTHQWGTDFTVWHAGGDKDGEQIFRSEDYETIDFPFEEPELVPAGAGFRFECAYQNTESYTLKFGLKATDEMCILFGNWYAAKDGGMSDQSCFVF